MNAMYVRADHVVSSYSDAVSLLERHSAPLRRAPHGVGPNLVLDPPLP